MDRREAADVFSAVCIYRTRPDVPADVAEAMDEVLRLVGGPDFAIRASPYEGTPLAAAQRRNAVSVIVGASELVGAHGLHLTAREVDDMPEKVQRALHVLGVSEQEIAAVDTED